MIETFTSSGCLAAACKVLSRLWAAVFSAAILPLEAIEPVLSRASARLSRLMPQMISAVAEIAISVVPIRVAKRVGTVALPVSLSEKLPCWGALNT